MTTPKSGDIVKRHRLRYLGSAIIAASIFVFAWLRPDFVFFFPSRYTNKVNALSSLHFAIATAFFWLLWRS
jgi:hypothetical protein